MSIHVHNSEHFEKLRQDLLTTSLSFKSRSSSSSLSSKLVASREAQMKRTAMKYELQRTEREAVRQKLAETIATSLQRKKTKKESQFLKLQQEVENGKLLVNELHDIVERQQVAKAGQYSRMHEEWTEKVYHKLNDPISSKVQAMNDKQHCADKAQAYQKFLDVMNEKGGLFRDIINEKEYNPLSDATFIKHRTKVDDPLKRTIRRRKEEDASAWDGAKILSDKSGGQLGRPDNLDVQLWSKGKFESTPFGFFHKGHPTTRFEGSKPYISQLKLDHYTIEKGPDELRQELPKRKRINVCRAQDL